MKKKNTDIIALRLCSCFAMLFACLVAGKTLHAQNAAILAPEAFIEQVKKFHPVAKQANLVTESAAASLLAAKGNFDPVAGYQLANKTLDGTNYYRYNNGEIKIPTTIGVDVKAGFENSSGKYINPELTNGVASYLGIEIPLLNGLLIDKKRAALQQAKIYQEQSQQERKSMINDLLFDAWVAYWQWAGSFKVYATSKNYVDVAQKRFLLTKTLFQNGDRAMADTLEALTQLQNFQLVQSEALLDLKNKAVDLSQFLWNEAGDPYLLPEQLIPDSTQFEQLRPLQNPGENLMAVSAFHPELQSYQFKLKSLEVERRLKFQSLLPTVNLQANALSKDYFAYKGLDGAYLQNNYKLGFNVRVPLFLRQGLGDYRNAKIKISQASLARNEKLWQLQNKVRQYYNEAVQRQQQLATAVSMFQNYRSLLRVEELKFSQGESSLFLINSRENKTLEMQQKLVELRVKYLKALYAIEWASGRLQ